MTFGLILPSKTQAIPLLVRCWLLSEVLATKTVMSTALEQILLKDACGWWTISSERFQVVTGGNWQPYRRFSHLIFLNLRTIKQMQCYWVLSALNSIFKVGQGQGLTLALTLFLDLLTFETYIYVYSNMTKSTSFIERVKVFNPILN